MKIHKSPATLLQQQKEDWAATWETADIEIDGDVKAQQAIRLNIFQLKPNLLRQTLTAEYRTQRIYRRKIWR